MRRRQVWAALSEPTEFPPVTYAAIPDNMLLEEFPGLLTSAVPEEPTPFMPKKRGRPPKVK